MLTYVPDRPLPPKACITLHQVGVLGQSLFVDNVIGPKDEAAFHGGYYELPPVYCYPKPAEPSHLGVIQTCPKSAWAEWESPWHNELRQGGPSSEQWAAGTKSPAFARL